MALGVPRISPAKRLPTKPAGTQFPTPGCELVLIGDRPHEVYSFECETVSFFVDAAALLGFPKSVAAVYGIVFASPDPLSFSEIAAKLNFSNGSVSQALRVLREMGAVRRAEDGVLIAEGGGQGTARERFVPDLELRKLVSRFIEQRLEKQLAAGYTRLEVLKRSIPTCDKRSNAELNRRLKSLADWHARAHQLMPLARTVLRITH